MLSSRAGARSSPHPDPDPHPNPNPNLNPNLSLVRTLLRFTEEPLPIPLTRAEIKQVLRPYPNPSVRTSTLDRITLPLTHPYP